MSVGMAFMSAHAACEPLAAGEPAKSSSNRVMSHDALRGFDMLWIIGGSGVSKAMNAWTGGPRLGWLTEQFAPVDWNGFPFEDLFFPLFLFISGVTMPF